MDERGESRFALLPAGASFLPAPLSLLRNGGRPWCRRQARTFSTASQTLCSLQIMAGDGCKSGCQTFKLVCTKPRRVFRARRRRQAAARWGCKPLILAVSWSGTCVEIICDSGQRVSCGGHAAAPQRAHTSTPN